MNENIKLGQDWLLVNLSIKLLKSFLETNKKPSNIKYFVSRALDDFLEEKKVTKRCEINTSESIKCMIETFDSLSRNSYNSIFILGIPSLFQEGKLYNIKEALEMIEDRGEKYEIMHNVNYFRDIINDPNSWM